MRRIWKGNAIPSTRKGRIVRSEQRERRTHLPKQMLRPKGAEGCSVSYFGSRKLLNHASIASEQRIFSPTRGTSELKKKDCLNFPEKDSFLTEERLHTRKEPHGVRLFCIYSRERVPCSITLCPNLWTTYAGSCGSAIERSRERQRRVRLPPQGIA